MKAKPSTNRAGLMKLFKKTVVEDFEKGGQEAMERCSPSKVPNGLQPVEASPEDLIAEYERRIVELKREIEQRAEGQQS
ncbi:hypothetical protein [Pelagibius sp. Alg239-R121]|uniref:hypothetical protein n=1 Tax=Pelagibius sp. Alg239-R121 TaxID=2993448 RepID=UPI0024A66F54|nr:hypothetical protein [Pelagibius sp. Alg239-R121]